MLFFSPACASLSRGNRAAKIPETAYFITFLGWYNNEKVSLMVDGKLILTAHITTDPSTGAAKFVELSSGAEQIAICVNSQVTGAGLTERINLRNGHYLYVGFDSKTKRFDIEQSRKAFLLD